MNFALPTVLIILALLPSIAFLGSYYSGNMPREIAPLTPLSEFAVYCVLAIPIDALAIRWLHPSFHPDELRVLTYVMVGDADAALSFMWPEASAYNFRSILSSLVDLGWFDLAWKYTLVIVLSSLAGYLARRFVLSTRLDLLPIASAPFRVRSDLYYLLLGRLRGVPRQIWPIADVLVSLGGKTKLYRGIVSSVMFGKDGQLDQLVLWEARKGRPIKSTTLRGDTRDLDAAVTTKWSSIPGSKFLVAGSSILSINMTYAEPSQPGADEGNDQVQ